MSQQPETLRVRVIGRDDLELLWRWATDPDVRRISLSPSEISLESHAKWFRAKMASPDSRIYVVELAGDPVGQVRYDRVSRAEAEIDVSIAAEHRGKGLGTRALALTREIAREELDVERVVGIVKVSNPASSAAFRKAGFSDMEQRLVEDQLCDVFCWPSS